MGPDTKRKRKSEGAKPVLQRKRKRNRELAEQEERLKRKRDKLQQRQGALFEDAGEQKLVFKKKSKRSKEGTESKLEGMEGEHEVNPIDSGEGTNNERNLDLYCSRNGQALDSRSTMDEQSMNPECREIGRSESSKEGQTTDGQKPDSKRRKKEQTSRSERSIEGQQSHSDSSEKEDNLISHCDIEGQELRDAEENNAEENNEEMLNMSKDIKENKKKKNKKKRDRWGQVLNDVGNTKESFYEDGDAAMPDNVAEPEDATLEDGTETLTKHDSVSSYKGEYDSKTVCAGGMPYDTSEEDILSFFKECGPVARVICMKFADTQRFKGLAFITFETETAASKALSLDGANMGDRLIKVEKARAGGKVLRAPPKREAGSLSVYIGNLDWNVHKIDIKRFFKGCDIDDVRLAVDKNTGDFRGYGHVDFSDEKSLEKAITMNQKQLLGRPVKVSYSVAKEFKGNSS